MLNSTTFPWLLVNIKKHMSVFILATQASNTGCQRTTWYSKVWAVVSIHYAGYGHFLYHFHSIYCRWHFTRKEYCTEKWQVYSYNLRSYECGFKSLSKDRLCFLYFSLRAVGVLLIGKRKVQKFYSTFMCFVLGPL